MKHKKIKWVKCKSCRNWKPNCICGGLAPIMCKEKNFKYFKERNPTMFYGLELSDICNMLNDMKIMVIEVEKGNEIIDL